MSGTRLALTMTVAVVIEVAIFQFAYRDLLWLNRPVVELQAASQETVESRVSQVLAREHLTRDQLETLAATTAENPELLVEYVTTLERLQQLEPLDLQVKVRLAEAYRRAGRLDAARGLFAEVLKETSR